MNAALRRCAEVLFSVLEHALTTALYPWCLLVRRSGAAVRVPILMYRQIGRPVAGVPGCRDCVSPERFERQIRAILKAGYRVIPLSTLIRELREGRGSGLGRSVVLTLDDGFRGQFVHAYPVLRRYRLSATLFVVSGYVGRYSFYRHLGLDNSAGAREGTPPLAWLPLSWDEVKEMQRHGVEIGSHSLSHRSLGLLPGNEAEFEARRSREVLEERLEAPVELFSYPFGSRACGDFDRDLEQMLRGMGYGAACTTVVGRCDAGVDLYALPRIPMENTDTPFRVRCKLRGAYDWVGWVESIRQRLLARENRLDAGLPIGTDCQPG